MFSQGEQDRIIYLVIISVNIYSRIVFKISFKGRKKKKYYLEKKRLSSCVISILKKLNELNLAQKNVIEAKNYETTFMIEIDVEKDTKKQSRKRRNLKFKKIYS